jgi:nitrate/nitrite transport system substrate-binding protein
MQGQYDNGIGKRWLDADPLQFFAGGEACFPYLSDGMWFLTQHRRWGLLRQEPDYAAIVARVNRVGLYREAAVLAGVPAPSNLHRTSRLMDGKLWNGSDPEGYATSFSIHALPAHAL